MSLLKPTQTIGLIALSNGLSVQQKPTLDRLEQTLEEMGLSTVRPPSLFAKESVYHASDKERAKMLMDFYKNPDIRAIFDVSGGDLANGVLSYLDYEWMSQHPKPFFGYSDLSVVLNALYTKTVLLLIYMFGQAGVVGNLVSFRNFLKKVWFTSHINDQNRTQPCI